MLVCQLYCLYIISLLCQVILLTTPMNNLEYIQPVVLINYEYIMYTVCDLCVMVKDEKPCRVKVLLISYIVKTNEQHARFMEQITLS